MKLDKSDAGIMHAALTELGLSPNRQGTLIYFGNGESIDTATGRSRLTPGREIASIKQAYSRQVVLSTAKKYGWQVKQTEANKFQIVKR